MKTFILNNLFIIIFFFSFLANLSLFDITKKIEEKGLRSGM